MASLFSRIIKLSRLSLGMVAYACNPSAWEAEGGGW
jgi:hypothetical protein